MTLGNADFYIFFLLIYKQPMFTHLSVQENNGLNALMHTVMLQIFWICQKLAEKNASNVAYVCTHIVFGVNACYVEAYYTHALMCILTHLFSYAHKNMLKTYAPNASLASFFFVPLNAA